MASSSETHRVPKEWGEEHWIVNRDYCGKKLVLKKGWRCSLHYHAVKDEVFYLIAGRVLLEIDGREHVMLPGDHHHIAPRTVHRFSGLEDSEIIEFSTHHEDADSHRLEKSGPFDVGAWTNRPAGPAQRG